MKQRILLPTLTALLVLCLSSCVDPYYYDDSTTLSASATYATLPHGYHTVHVSGIPYYYCGSRWYRRSGSHYVVCSRPYGYYGHIGRPYHHHRVSHLPYGCRTTYVGAHRYYNHGSQWYRKSGNAYVSCSKPKSHSSHKHKKHHYSEKHRDHDRKSHQHKGARETKKIHGQKNGNKRMDVVKDDSKHSGHHQAKSNYQTKNTSYPVSLSTSPRKTSKKISASKKTHQRSKHSQKKSTKSSRPKHSSKSKKKG